MTIRSSSLPAAAAHFVQKSRCHRKPPWLRPVPDHRSRHYDRPIASLSRQLGEIYRPTRNHWPPTGDRNSLTLPTKAHLAGLEAHQEET
jgi:hypothetical protein